MAQFGIIGANLAIFEIEIWLDMYNSKLQFINIFLVTIHRYILIIKGGDFSCRF